MSLASVMDLLPRFETREYAMRRIGYSSLWDRVGLRSEAKRLGIRHNGVASICDFIVFGCVVFQQQIGAVQAIDD